jgi:non-lysosomal glucosylceramidase
MPLIGAVSCRRSLNPGESTTVVFAVAWHFPAYSGGKVFFSTMENIPDLTKKRRYYSHRFPDSKSVAAYVAGNLDRLAGLTRLWKKTWYDSTLPVWFLDRTFLNTSILATQTCHRFDDGRFYGWEGVDSCPGTCQHVWMYAQAVAHVFPALERITRERVDFGIAYHTDGSMDYRAEGSTHGEQAIAPMENPGQAVLAADGMAGTIIRVYREHKMCPDSQFLARLWPKVRKSIEFMMGMDKDADGLLEGPQYNTLDATWYGRIPSISSLFLGVMAVGRAMALEMGDTEFGADCARRLEAGRRNFVDKLFNGEYFEHQPDATKPDTLSLDDGCYIDQVLGQSFAHQVGFERVIPAEESRSALRAIWKYSFAPDAGAYRDGFKRIQGGRWYAMHGEPGIIMCTWPLEQADRGDIKHTDMGLGVSAEAYFNECMNGFEYQVAAHMIAEGMVDDGLAIARSIDERYAPAKRNPWNEVECGDHYSRSMASYGVYLAACGVDYHGPAQTLEFDPKVRPENFRCALIGAEGWGTYAQRIIGDRFEASLTVRHGQLVLRKLSVYPRIADGTLNVAVEVGGASHTLQASCIRGRVDIPLPKSVLLAAVDQDRLSVVLCRNPLAPGTMKQDVAC